jgi:tetratricopeptide (TPR) repeat protein
LRVAGCVGIIYVMATISEAWAIAIEHHQAGRLQAAERIYRQILQVQPNHADALHCLGVIASQVGKHEVAVEYIGRAIGLKGSAAAFHNNLGKVYLALRRIPDAVTCCHRALELEPEYAEAHNNLGAALSGQGKLDEATACFRRALVLKPDLAEAHNNLGNALKDQGKRDEAVACYRQALELKPDFAEAHYQLGNALKDQGKLDEAVACYRRVLVLKPDFAEAQINLGNALNGQGKLDEALACYRRTLELKPDYAEAHSNLGGLLEELGDIRGAENCFRAALRHDCRLAFAHYQLAALLRGNLPHEDLVAQRRLLEETTLTDVQRLFLHFGLGQVLDARGEYAEAAEHLDRANALQRSEWRKGGREYDPKERESLVTRVIAAFTPDFFQRVRGFGLESELPVFVVGLPRSGTTLVEQILASHSQVFGAGEIKLSVDTMAALGGDRADLFEGLNRLDRATARRLASRHLQRLRDLDRRALRIVDKLPDNYLFLGLLAVSCWMTHFREIRWANDPEQMASQFHQYQRIMEHWRKVLPVPLLEVDYEETVTDPEGVARKLVAWCGLAWEPACLEFHQAQRPVRTPSAVQVRQPVYRTSVGRWKHYEQALASLLAPLDSVVARRQFP